MNPDAIPDDIDALVSAAAEHANKAGEITTPEAAQDAKDIVAEIHELGKLVEKTRKKEKAPHLAASRAVDAKYKPYTDKLDAAKRAFNARLTAWARRIDDERRARAEALRKEQEEAIRNGSAHVTPAFDTSDDPVFAAPTPKTRTFTEYVVDDISKVPVEFLQVDMAKVRAHIQAGNGTPPGIRVVQEKRAVC